MGTHADLPSEHEATSLDDLVADCAEVRHVLDESRAAAVPPPRRLAIPDTAVAVVAGLDTYGD
jgi:hypothetical protein